MTEPIDRYRFWLRTARGLADNTVIAYAGDVGRFLGWLDAQALAVEDIGPLVLGAYVHHLTQDGKRRTSIKRAVAAIRSYYRFLTSTRRIDASPIPPSHRYSLKSESAVPRYLGSAAADRLLGAAVDATPIGLRDRALMEMMYATGVRLGEAHGMDVGDVDRLKTNVLVSGKGGHERVVLYGMAAADALHLYLDRGRPNLAPGDEDDEQAPLWLNRYGGRLSRRSIHEVIASHADAAGLSSGIHPHTLRHSFATAMLEGGANLRVIQDLMGHRSVGTTQLYTHVTKREARQSYLAHHPMAQPGKPRLIIRA